MRQPVVAAIRREIVFMLPARFAPFLFGFILSGLMSFMVSGIATFRAVGLVPHFATLWIGAWLPSWAVAFPAVLVVAPLTRRIVGRLVKAPKPS